MVNSWLNSIQEHLFPPVCRLCRARGWRGLDLCRACLADLPRLAPGCPLCARPLAAAPGLPCAACSARPPAYDHCIALFSYEFPVDRLIQQLKFAGDLTLARSLGCLLARQLQASDHPLPQRIVPVPLHPARQARRGYNQARELARPLRGLGLRLDETRVRRVRHTPPQTGLDAARRRSNLRGAFAVRGRLDGCRVALVDDVMTTGSTLDALAAVLKQAGAARVEAWVIARTPKR